MVPEGEGINKTIIINLILNSLSTIIPITLINIKTTINKKTNIINIKYKKILIFSTFFKTIITK